MLQRDSNLDHTGFDMYKRVKGPNGWTADLTVLLCCVAGKLQGYCSAAQLRADQVVPCLLDAGTHDLDLIQSKAYKGSKSLRLAPAIVEEVPLNSVCTAQFSVCCLIDKLVAVCTERSMPMLLIFVASFSSSIGSIGLSMRSFLHVYDTLMLFYSATLACQSWPEPLPLLMQLQAFHAMLIHKSVTSTKPVRVHEQLLMCKTGAESDVSCAAAVSQGVATGHARAVA